MISVSEADELLQASFQPTPTERVPLRLALGRVLREHVLADRDYPPFDRVAMDGIAIARSAYFEGQREFAVQGLQAAGMPPQTLHAHDACFEAMTGAVLPHGCDAVLRYEDVRVEGGKAHVPGTLELAAKNHVHARGSDARAGERLLAAGTRLLPPQIAVLASVGKAEVQVARAPRIAFVSTGDEVVDVGATPEAHQIRGSNGHAIAAALAAAGYDQVRLAHSGDSEAALASVLSAALNDDIVLISGGVSMGKRDYVPATLERLGVRPLFHKLAQKPGKPLWFGLSRDDKPVFGLPGNPVSSLVCVYRYVLPQLERASGALPMPPPRVALASYARLRMPFTHFVTVRLQDGVAHPVESTGSGDFVSLTRSDGFVEVAPSAPLERVPFYSWQPRACGRIA